ncbi:hypothetical protein ETD83_12995 [Actinomadura soli]|uniref:Uncharacterized protein n=1 Tax=Actinomadura soli TaxID=2508997 RepID=A0A5C4JEE5_9ACTN|nr:hypothetical protein [Actinomadura soli]TMR02210.1 hypothetical protein ETD83_12995 [Actinomadura soli]
MGLRARLLRFAHARPRAFVITAPGSTRTRLFVEAELRRRGGRPVASPAAAAMLVVCGRPGADLMAAVHTVWEDMPGPRSLVRLDETASADDVAAGLDLAARELADVDAQWADARARRDRGPWSPAGEDDHMFGSAHHHSASSEPDHNDHGDHGGGHEHHMGAPMGLPMAGRAPDRDGLKLDVLHIPLGPALSDWPAGLVLDLTLQGDVIQAAEALTTGGSATGPPFWEEPWLRAAAGEPVTTGEAERRRAACHLDSVGRLLAVAGWDNAADQARVLRDRLISGEPGRDLAPRITGFTRRAGRSRVLRWMLRDVGVIDPELAERHQLTGPPARRLADASARLSGWLDEVGAAMERLDDPAPLRETEGPRGPVGGRPGAAVLALLPGLLDGAELAAARLTVASLDPGLDQIAVLSGTTDGRPGG